MLYARKKPIPKHPKTSITASINLPINIVITGIRYKKNQTLALEKALSNEDEVKIQENIKNVKESICSVDAPTFWNSAR